MGFGYVSEEGDPVVTDSLLQGGIVGPSPIESLLIHCSKDLRRFPCTILEPSLAVS
jgi:hypothetical protein